MQPARSRLVAVSVQLDIPTPRPTAAQRPALRIDNDTDWVTIGASGPNQDCDVECIVPARLAVVASIHHDGIARNIIEAPRVDDAAARIECGVGWTSAGGEAIGNDI